jgi:hypothetical protein
VRSVRDLLDDGCNVCGAALLEMVSVFPAAISFALASDRSMWSRPRVVMLCSTCAADHDRQTTNPEDGGNYFAD